MGVSKQENKNKARRGVGMLTMLRSPPEHARKRRVPDGLQGGVVGLAFLQRPQPLSLYLLYMLDAFQLHLNIV